MANEDSRFHTPAGAPPTVPSGDGKVELHDYAERQSAITAEAHDAAIERMGGQPDARVAADPDQGPQRPSNTGSPADEDEVEGGR